MNHHYARKITLIVVIALLAGTIAYSAYRYHNLNTTYKETVAENERAVKEYEERILDLSQKLSVSEEGVLNLSQALQSAEDKVKDGQHNIEQLSDTVGTLRKLTEIDPELLKKYSKIYFLNENYVPSALSVIDPKYVSAAGRKLEIHHDVWPQLEKLLESSKDSGGTGLLVASSYRSFGTQAILKSSYKITYGTTAANRFSAEQGYSEHQLGTTVDLTTAKLGSLSASFDMTPEFTWLTEHAHEYGFVLSYPKNNKYYIYEPWHWRYVGIDLATKLHDEKKYLYDMDQREIDGYLVSIFD